MLHVHKIFTLCFSLSLSFSPKPFFTFSAKRMGVQTVLVVVYCSRMCSFTRPYLIPEYVYYSERCTNSYRQIAARCYRILVHVICYTEQDALIFLPFYSQLHSHSHYSLQSPAFIYLCIFVAAFQFSDSLLLEMPYRWTLDIGHWT